VILHDVEHSPQVREVIAFVETFHGDVIDLAFYGLTYMLVKDRIYGTLIVAPAFFKPKGITV